MFNVSNHTVIVGSIGLGENYSFYGCGFILSVEDRAFVVTCRHVVSKPGENNKGWFIVYDACKTSEIRKAIRIKNPIFYNLNQPYVDLAVMEVLNYSATTLVNNGIEVFPMNDYDEDVNNFCVGDRVSISGFPMDYVSMQIKEEKPNERILPIQTNGIIIDRPLSDNTIHPHNGDGISYVADSSIGFALVDLVQNIDGMSGSPVINRSTDKVCGMLFAGQQGIDISGCDTLKSVFLIMPISIVLNFIKRL